jgi:hypothetical protein
MSPLLQRRSTSARTPRPGRRPLLTAALLIVGPLALVASTVPESGASAATTARPAARSVALATAAPRTSVFCTDAANAAANNTSAAATASVASLENDYAKLKADESIILADSPSAIKGDWQTLFTFLNKFYSELASVKYDFIKLPTSYLSTLETDGAPAEAAAKAIDAYIEKNCGIKEP